MGSSTSSSKNKKLYDYLEGYESACFTGSLPEDLASSIKLLIEDVISVLFPNNAEEVCEDIRKNILKLVNRYIEEFYITMKRTAESQSIKILADNCKQDYEFLRDLVNVCCTMDCSTIAPIRCLIFRDDETALEMDLCNKCPYYLPRKKCRIALLYEKYTDGDETEEVYLPHHFSFAPTRLVALAIMKCFNYLTETQQINHTDIHQYKYLFQSILSCATIYTQMNPSREARREQLDKSIETLKGDPVDQETEEFIKNDKLLSEVFDDISSIPSKQIRYVSDIQKALQKTSIFRQSKYDEESDSYISLHGTGQRHSSGISISLISSVIEVDPYKDQPQTQAFDNYINYHSPYLSLDEADNLMPDLHIKDKYRAGIRTILINNPSKFKGRIIHIMDNPLQDRLTWIHNRVQAITDNMITDSSRDQESGRKFAQMQTYSWKLSSLDSKFGVYCFDFAAPTDTLDFYIQHRIMKFIFNDIVADFWDYVNSLPSIIEIDGELVDVYQARKGNKQGEKGSFSVFSLCHHFIYLMLAKHFNREDADPMNYYRICGDDVIATSFGLPERDYYDEDDHFIDSEDIPRSIIEEKLFQICETFAGFVINYDKSVTTHYNSPECRAEFCKVTYCNGEFISPWPVRLAMNYAKSLNSQIAFATWCADRRLYAIANNLMTLILDRFNDPTLTMIIRSGEIPYLKPFEDPTINIRESDRSRIRFCYAINIIETTVLCSIMKDHDRERARYSQFELKEFTKIINRILRKAKKKVDLNNLPPDHKLNKVMIQNDEISLLFKDIFELNDPEMGTLAILTSPLIKSGSEVINVLYELSKTLQLLRLAEANPDQPLSEVFPDFELNYAAKLNALSNRLLPRSLTQRPQVEVVVLQSINALYKSICRILD